MIFLDINEQEPEAVKQLEARSMGIKDACYEDYTAARLLENVLIEDKAVLFEASKRNEDIFTGTLGKQKEEYHIPLQPGSIPCAQRAYPIPKIYEETTRKEIN